MDLSDLLLVAGAPPIGVLEGVEVFVGVQPAGEVEGAQAELGAVAEDWRGTRDEWRYQTDVRSHENAASQERSSKMERQPRSEAQPFRVIFTNWRRRIWKRGSYGLADKDMSTHE